MRSRMICFSSLSNASCAFCAVLGVAVAVRIAGVAARAPPPRRALVASWRSSLSSTCVASSSAAPCASLDLRRAGPRRSAGPRPRASACRPSRPARAAAAHSFLISSWAMSSASRISASGISLAPASTIRMASSVPATMRSRSVSSRRSSSVRVDDEVAVDLADAHGADRASAAGCRRSSAPRRRRSSRGCRRGARGRSLSGIATSCVSKCQPLGNSGRIGRSIMRAVSVPFSPARPSRLKNEPGILPAAYIRSSTSTVSGRKSTSRRLPAVAVLRTMVSPWRTTTAPEACLAILPVSKEISLPAISTETG